MASTIGSLHMTDFETWIVDFSYINMLVEMKGEELCDGVLGTDILTRKSAVIDYKGRNLYLKVSDSSTPPSKKLSDRSAGSVFFNLLPGRYRYSVLTRCCSPRRVNSDSHASPFS